MNDIYILVTNTTENFHGPIYLDNIPKHETLNLESLFVGQTGFKWENVYRFEFIDNLPDNAIKLVLNINHIPCNNKIYLTKKQSRIINKKKNTYLWIFSPWEAVIGEEEKFLQQIKSSYVENKKIIITTSSREYDGKTIDGIRFCSMLDFWECQYRHYLKHFSNVSFRTPDNTKKTLSNASKKFICLNRNLKHHRVWTYYLLILKKTVIDGHVSFHLPSCAKQEETLDYNFFVERSLYRVQKKENKKIKELMFVDKKLDDLDNNYIMNNRNSIVPYYQDSLFSIVTESLLPQDFVTEKTFKAIMHCHPYVIIGSKKTTKRLRDKGYMTFEDIFGIDAIETPDELNNFLDHLNSFTLSEWKEKVKEVWPKVEHNWNHYLKSKNDFSQFSQRLECLINER